MYIMIVNIMFNNRIADRIHQSGFNWLLYYPFDTYCNPDGKFIELFNM